MDLIDDINGIIRSLENLKSKLSGNKKVGLKAKRSEPAEPITPATPRDVSEQLNSENWPLAVPKELLCQSPDDKRVRAEGIVEQTLPANLTGKTFLDFGCGEGHIVEEVRKRNAKLAIGYDIDPGFEKAITDYNKIREQGPFDVILLYDVLDHVEDPAIVLKQVFDLCHKNTEVYITCHPWLSRHGGHLHPTINKAFVHVLQVKQPLPQHFSDFGTYQKMFVNAGFTLAGHTVRTNRVEDFVLKGLSRKHLEWVAQSGELTLSKLVWRMRNSFFDFVLKTTANPQEKPYPVVILQQTVGNGNNVYHTLFSNGKINDPTGRNEWRLNRRQLVMRWPRENAPNGAWVDTCILNEDLQSYIGTNQNEDEIIGSLV